MNILVTGSTGTIGLSKSHLIGLECAPLLLCSIHWPAGFH